ncbi:MAG: hypothetical protein A2Y12_12590 [Planctomycetes bacterium GWF2_42_9]|nr:MAG: hypothetical protein A2Y12_12590 [Planctomycetes bacterium GWF2_42_9]
MLSQVEKEFLNPSSSYRAKPFWALNAKLDATELRRQIRIFHDMGFGGFFMHARVGLATPYLGSEWFDLVQACIDEVHKLDMEAWLYDEDRWPSGAAGGLVTRHSQYQARYMEAVRLKTDGEAVWPEVKDALAQYVFALSFEGEKVVEYRRLSDVSQLKKLQNHEEVVVFDVKCWPSDNWFNGFTYLDTLNQDAVAEFIRITHEQYREAVGNAFGNDVPGIFTDEPCHGPIYQRFFISSRTIVWTDTLGHNFSNMFGYDVIEKLPELFYDTAGRAYSQARHHYHRCSTRMFVEAFSRQIGEWCQHNNLLHTGHVLEERPLSSQASLVGSAMQFYQYMQAPGIDNLTKLWDEYITAKQCASVVRQMGRKWMLSELYGCTGWETTFATYKYIGDWQAVLGVTLRCPHLSWYSMAGESKRDYPASIHFQSSWWQHYHVLEDYYSRLNVLLSEGIAICDLAVLHPIESYGLLLREGSVVGDSCNFNMPDPQIKSMDQMYERLVRDLLAIHMDFDFLDEHLLVELQAAVEHNHDVKLCVGRAQYKMILVPPILTMRSTTLDLLQKFIDAGGKVIFAGEVCKLVEALPDVRPQRLAEGRTTGLSPQELEQTLGSSARRVSICEEPGHEVRDIFYQLRRTDEKIILFLVNTNQQRAYAALNIRVSVPGFVGGQIQLWDAMTGNHYALAGVFGDEYTEFCLNLTATGSALVVIAAHAERLLSYAAPIALQREIPLLPTEWHYRLDDHNVLVLDSPCAKAVADGRTEFVHGAEEILRLDDRLRDWLGIPKRGGAMIQPWAMPHADGGPKALLTLHYDFDIKHMPDGVVWLALEQVERWLIKLNGMPIIASTHDGWWVDPAIKKIRLPVTMLTLGRNVLELTGTFDRRADLEIIYLLGNFGVDLNLKKGPPYITRLPDYLKLGSWLQQGLPFYAGNILYSMVFEHTSSKTSRYVLCIEKNHATAVEVFVNGTRAGLLMHGDYSIDITNSLKCGSNCLELRLLGSRRNAMGPLHLADDDPVWVGPDQFRSKNEKWQQDYKLVDYGLYGPPRLLERID